MAKAVQQNRKKRGFFQQRFTGSQGGGVAAALWLLVLFPMAAVSAPAGTAILLFGWCLAGASIMGGFLASLDVRLHKKEIFNTAAGQNVSGRVWAKQLYASITCKLVRLAQKTQHYKDNPKKLAALEKQKGKLFTDMRDLEDYLTVVDVNGTPTGEKVQYVTRYPDIEIKETRNYAADSVVDASGSVIEKRPVITVKNR